jgi:hypothetical protein
MNQIDIKTASYRVLHTTPGHITYGVWINGGKCGDLVVRVDEQIAFEQMMGRGGFELNSLAQKTFSEVYDENARRRRQYED